MKWTVLGSKEIGPDSMENQKYYVKFYIIKGNRSI
jgi:hypothetical protein